MLKCTPLASGSKGNAYLLQFDQYNYLVDIGISYRQLCLRLSACGISANDISGVFITHEHVDHVRGLPIFLKNHPIPVFLTHGSAKALAKVAPLPEHLFYQTPQFYRFKLDNIDVVVLPTRHDATQPCAFQFHHSLGSLLLMTDTGEAPPQLCQALNETDILVIESNHDEHMLKIGPYPASLKKRILSPLGHLSNRQASDLINKHASSRLKHIFLAHLSEHNNLPSLAQQVLSEMLRPQRDRFSCAAHLTFQHQPGQQVCIGETWSKD